MTSRYGYAPQKQKEGPGWKECQDAINKAKRNSPRLEVASKALNEHLESYGIRINTAADLSQHIDGLIGARPTTVKLAVAIGTMSGLAEGEALLPNQRIIIATSNLASKKGL